MKIIAKSGNGKMLKIGENEKSNDWYFLSEAVIKFVEKSIKVGDEVTIKYEKSGGKATITYITKGKGESTSTPPKETKSTEPTCEDCGKVLKDSKYKKCYTCNQKNPSKKYKKSSSTDELIKREAVAHATSRVMIGLQGHIEPNNVCTIFTTVYNLILKLVENR